MKCPNLSDPEVKESFNSLKNQLGEKTAFMLLGNNEGYPIDKDKKGKDSTLIKEILKIPSLKNKEVEALKAKIRTLTDSFVNSYVGETYENTGEPKLFYHGTVSVFDEFDSSKKRYSVHKKGIFFSSSLRNGLRYGREIYAAYLNSDDLHVVDFRDQIGHPSQLEKLRDLENAAIEKIFKNNSKPIIKLLTHDKEGFNVEQYIVKDNSYIQKAVNIQNPLQNIINTEELSTEDSLKALQQDIKIQQLVKALGVKVIIDNNIREAGAVVPRNDYRHKQAIKEGYKGVILVNPKLLSNDTVLHEIAHIVLDNLEQTYPNFTSEVYDEIVKESPDIVKEIEEKYSELTSPENTEVFMKEVIATFIGRKGIEKLQKDNNNVFKTLAKRIVDFFKLILGINPSRIDQLLDYTLNEEKLELLDAQIYNDIFYYQKTEESKKTTQNEKRIFKSISSIKGRIKIIKAKYKQTNQKEFLTEIEELLENLDSYDLLSSGFAFTEKVKTIVKTFNDNLTEKLKKGEKISLTTLNKSKIIVDAFKLVNHLVLEVSRMEEELKLKDELSEEEKNLLKEIEVLKEDIGASLVEINQFESIYINEVTKILPEHLMPYYSKIRKQYEKDYEDEFDENNKQLKKVTSEEEYLKERNKYVANKIEENIDEINNKTKKHIENLLFNLGKDISLPTQLLSSPRQTQNELIQIVVRLFDEYDLKIKNKTDQMILELHNIFQEYKNYVGNKTNPKDLYEDIIELDQNGNPTGYFTSVYHSSFIKERNQFIRKLKKQNLNEKEQKAKYKAWVKGRKKSNPVYQKLLQLPENHPKKKFFLKLRELNEFIYNSTYGSNASVVKEFDYILRQEIEHKIFRLPQIEKSIIGRINDNSIFSDFSSEVKNAFTRTSKIQEELGESGTTEKVSKTKIKKIFTLTNERNEENKKIPLHYRRRLKPNNISLDIMTSMALDLHNAINFSEKEKIRSTIESLTDILANDLSTVQKHLSGIAKINPVTQEDITEKTRDSKLFKMYKELVDSRLYGINIKDAGRVQTAKGEIDLNQVNNKILGYTGLVLLGVNLFAGGVNAIVGNISNLIEAIGREYFTVKDLFKASIKYKKDTKNLIGDLNRNVPVSLTNLLAEKFNIFHEKTLIKNPFEQNNAAKRLLKSSTLMFATNITEHAIQSKLMYAVLYNIKVQNDKTGEMVPLAEVFEVKNNKLTVKEGFEKAVNNELIAQVSRKIAALSEELHGNYDPKNKNQLQKYAVGMHLMLFRKWLIPGFQRRFRGGLSSIFKEFDEAREERFYSELLEGEREGSYITFLRLIRSSIVKKQFNILNNYKNLNQHERANIRKTTIELALVILFYAASKLLAGIGKDSPEDDKKFYYTLAYLFRRTSSELGFYVSGDALDIISTPGATTSMLKRLTDLTGQLINDPLEKYQRGKKDYKIIHKVKRVLPITSQTERDILKAYNFIDG